MDILQKIETRKAVVGVVGLGYVGLPLAVEFCRKGFTVIGFDVDLTKIDLLKAQKSYIPYISLTGIGDYDSRFIPTADLARLGDTDCVIVCLPTPLDKHREPDMRYVFESAHVIARHLKKGQLIILTSTTYPGTTDEDFRAILEQSESGLKAGEDFLLAYAPEREDPNNRNFTTATTPKVVGGLTPACLEAASRLFETIVAEVVPVSSTKAAEAAKLLENIYRSVNIALVNELKILFDRMGIDIWEVVEAAKTKPFGFQAFYPGPGLGGHCIPIDPFYLTWKAREFDFNTRFIELAGEINTHMPYYVVDKTVGALNTIGVSIKGAAIFVLGLAYKKDINDTRESPSLKLIELLLERGANVEYNDPYLPHAPKTRKYDFGMDSVPVTRENLARFDCVIIATDHSDYDPAFIVEHSRLLVDTRNLTKGLLNGKIVKA